MICLTVAGMQDIAMRALVVHRLGPRCMGETLHNTSALCGHLCCRSIQATAVSHLAYGALRLTQSFFVALLRGVPQHLNGLLPPELEQKTLVLQGAMSILLSYRGSFAATGCASAVPGCTC